jgi:integrase/recombinase XerD
MKVTLRKMKLKTGKQSLFLDITDNGRKREYLKLFVHSKPKDYLEKKHNEETMRQAEQIRHNRQLELQARAHGMEYIAPTDQTFNQLFEEFNKNYPHKDFKKYTATLKKFESFAGGKPLFLNQKFVDEFGAYLKKDLHGETPFVYFMRFKKICLLAYSKRIIRTDPNGLNWKMRYDKNTFRKEVLTEEELRKLANAPCGNENVKRLFLFCCNTGLRFGDARDLKWSDIKNGQIAIEQGKTGRRVKVDLNTTAKRMAGPQGKDTEHVFDLKGIDGINKVIKKWYEKAKLTKHITTHSARHTFCTMLMKNKVDSRTIIGLMGWSEGSGMKQLMRYAHLVDESLKAAVDGLPEY